MVNFESQMSLFPSFASFESDLMEVDWGTIDIDRSWIPDLAAQQPDSMQIVSTPGSPRGPSAWLPPLSPGQIFTVRSRSPSPHTALHDAAFSLLSPC